MGRSGGTAATARATGGTLSEQAGLLAERVKELKCLHSISRMLKGGSADLDEILQRVVNVLPGACQFPDLACACISLKNRRFTNAGYRASRRAHQVDIVIDGAPAGMLELGYADVLPDGREPDLLPEELTLLATVGDRLTEIVALKEAQHQLAAYQDHLRSLAAELALAEERERRGLAINLHDRIGQSLAVTKLKLETLKQVLPPEFGEHINDVSALIKEMVSDTRTLTSDISPPVLYELGLEPAVVWLGEHVAQQFGLRVDVACDVGRVDVSEAVRIVLFRSIQEVLMNTVKHARASRATVRLAAHGTRELRATLEDDGIGFDVQAQNRAPSAASGFGLFSIRERIGYLGGRVTIASTHGRGTRIQLVVPAQATGERGREA